jgi:glucose/arabinose dehydrogenase
LTLGDYDRPIDKDPPEEQPPQDLGTPVGKVLRIDKRDGSAPPDNPFVSEPDADPRVFAYGFHLGFNFTFHPQDGRMYGSDSTGVTCEEINIIEKGLNYGWPAAGVWPYNDCEAAQKTPAIHLLAGAGLKASDFKSTVGVSGMEFISGAKYPSLGDSLVVCESGTQLLRRLVLSPPNLNQVSADDVISRDCRLDVAIGPDGLIYYSNQTEIRRLVPPLPTSSQP